MLQLTRIEPGDILRIKPMGALTAADFTGLSEFADASLKENARLPCLLIDAQAFPGWNSFAGFVARGRFLRDHLRDVERIAVVTDSPIAHLVEMLANPFVAADIRYFPFAQYDAALHWLRTLEPALTDPKRTHVSVR